MHDPRVQDCKRTGSAGSQESATRSSSDGSVHSADSRCLRGFADVRASPDTVRAFKKKDCFKGKAASLPPLSTVQRESAGLFLSLSFCQSVSLSLCHSHCVSLHVYVRTFCCRCCCTTHACVRACVQTHSETVRKGSLLSSVKMIKTYFALQARISSFSSSL